MTPRDSADAWPIATLDHIARTTTRWKSLAHVTLVAVTLAACSGDPRSDASTADVVTVDRSDVTSVSDAIDGASPDSGTADVATDAAPDDASVNDAGTSNTPCWPFDQPSIETLRASPHKVFAHYFSPFPLSLDNRPPDRDYYATQYLQPSGESGAHAYCGGFLRERPYDQTPWPSGVDWEEQNMEVEVRRAIAIGLDGFTYDVLSASPTSIHRVRLDKLLTAASRVDPGFVIQPVLDMTSLGSTDTEALANLQMLFSSVGSAPALQRLADGRIVVSAFAAERRSAAFWTNALDTLASMGHRIAFVPMTVGSWSSNASHFAGVTLYGASSWGTRTVAGAASLRSAPDAPHTAGLVWMGPVAPQDSRPKDLTYVESDNSQAFRAQWESTIAGSADWVQLITWSDYSEDSEIEPSSRTHSAFYDLSAYYIAWFKSGTQPPIVRDTIYYFHRTQDMNAAPDLTQQRSAYRAVNGPTTSSNYIEVVGLLTAAGTLEIEIAGRTSSMPVDAGIQSFRIPLVEGTPVFRLVRAGATVVSLTSSSPISNTIVYQDPLYHAGASMTCAH